MQQGVPHAVILPSEELEILLAFLLDLRRHNTLMIFLSPHIIPIVVLLLRHDVEGGASSPHSIASDMAMSHSLFCVMPILFYNLLMVAGQKLHASCSP